MERVYVTFTINYDITNILECLEENDWGREYEEEQNDFIWDYIYSDDHLLRVLHREEQDEILNLIYRNVLTNAPEDVKIKAEKERWY